MDFSFGHLLPELVLTAAGLLVVVADLFWENKRGVGYLAVLGVLATLATLPSMLGRQGEAWANMIVVDGFAVFFKALFLIIAALTVLASFDYVERKQIHAGEFYALVLFGTTGAMLMAASFDLLMIWLGLELLAISCYALAGMIKDDARSLEASIKFFLIGAMTSAVLLFGISLIYGVSGSTHLQAAAAGLAAQGAMRPVMIAGLVFLVAGFGFKVAAVPFHMWAPDTYQGAPTPISAFLIAGSEAAAFAAILRVFTSGFAGYQVEWSTIFTILAVLTMTYGNLTAIVQTNVKRMLAYSAIAQAGYVLVGLAVATPESIGAMLYYLLAYAFMTLGTFGVVILLANNLQSEEISDFVGLSQRQPWYAAAMVVFMLSMIGIPPTAGFFGKFYLIQASVQSGAWWLALVIVLNSVISVGYYYGIVRNMYLVPAGEEKGPMAGAAGLGTVVAVSAVASLLLGLYPVPFLDWVAAAQAATGIF